VCDAREKERENENQRKISYWSQRLGAMQKDETEGVEYECVQCGQQFKDSVQSQSKRMEWGYERFLKNPHCERCQSGFPPCGSVPGDGGVAAVPQLPTPTKSVPPTREELRQKEEEEEAKAARAKGQELLRLVVSKAPEEPKAADYIPPVVSAMGASAESRFRGRVARNNAKAPQQVREASPKRPEGLWKGGPPHSRTDFSPPFNVLAAGSTCLPLSQYGKGGSSSEQPKQLSPVSSTNAILAFLRARQPDDVDMPVSCVSDP